MDTIQNQIDYIEERTARWQQRTRRELECALRSYYMWHAPHGAVAGDVNNLVQQGMDAVEAVLANYPPFRQTATFGDLGILVMDTRTLATD